MKTGKVWLAGAGPGDSGLLTIKAKHLIETADVVVYDRLVSESILSLIPSHTETIDVGKNSGNHPVPQEEINEILLNEAKKGKKVLRLKGGDPFVFGRGGEELELLCEHNIPYEIVPGITSAIAVSAYAGIPVTHRDYCSSVHIITAHRKRGDNSLPDFETLAKLDGTLVFLMGVSALNVICDGLIHAGMDNSTPAAILEKGTSSKQRRIVGTLDTLPNLATQANIQSPSIIVVGKVCALADQFEWAERRMLHGCRVIVTRPKDRSSSLARKLKDLGAEVILLPSIETKPILENKTLQTAFQNLERFHWIAFTSPAGAEVFFSELHRQGLDSRCLASHKFAAIGPATAKAVLQHGGILCDYQPDEFTGKALGEGLCKRVLDSETVLLPRSSIGTDEVLVPLNNHGISYEDLPIYDTTYPPCKPICLQKDDILAFTSASTVSGFVAQIQDYQNMTALCIGEQTAKEATRHGMNCIVAENATIDSMIETLIAYHQERKESL